MSQNLEPEEFIKRAKQIEGQKRKRSIVVTSIIVVITIAFILYTVLSLNTNNSEKEIVKNENKSLQKNIAKKDSALTVINNSLSKQDSLRSIITTYFRLRNEHNADSLELFYTDTVKNYFKNLKNISKKIITSSDKKYWLNFKSDKFIIEGPIQIDLTSLEPRAIVKGKQCYNKNNCFDEFIEIHLDINGKISFIKAYYEKN